MPKFDYYEFGLNPGRFCGCLKFARHIGRDEFCDIPDDTFPVLIWSANFEG